MKTIDISNLTEAQATLLMPLWARAVENRRPNPLIIDHKAVAIVDDLDFDFDVFIQRRVPQADYCIRATVLDRLVVEFLEKNPDGTVVEFGVGLDTRFDRLDNKRVTWIEIDLPHVIDLRLQFFEATNRRHILSGSLLDQEWIDQVKQIRRGPTLFLAEGVLYFLAATQVDTLLEELVEHFPESAFLFDTQSPWFLWFSNLRQPVKNAQMKFSVGDVRKLSERHPRVRVHRWIGFGDSPYYDRTLHRFSRSKRLARRCFTAIRSMFKIIELRW